MFEQGHTSCFGEFRIQPEHVDRERDLVDNSLSGWLGLRPKFKVVWGVVQAVAVFVVNVLVFEKRAPKNLLHDDAVLVRLSTVSVVETPVARRMHMTFGIYRSPLTAFVAALGAAKTVLVAEARQASVSVLQTLALCGCTTICTLKGGRIHAFGHEAHYTAVMAL